MRPKTEEIISKQLEIWKNRVWFPDVEPEREEKDGNMVLKDNEQYNNLYKRTKFSFVYAEDKESIYKFLRYGIEKSKIYNSNIIFARSSLFEAYIDVDASLRDAYSLSKELIEIISKEYANKWVVCDELNIEFHDKLAVYFLTQLQKAGCRGFIIHCDNKLPNNIYSCINSSKAADIFRI